MTVNPKGVFFFLAMMAAATCVALNSVHGAIAFGVVAALVFLFQ